MRHVYIAMLALFACSPLYAMHQHDTWDDVRSCFISIITGYAPGNTYVATKTYEQSTQSSTEESQEETCSSKSTHHIEEESE